MEIVAVTRDDAAMDDVMPPLGTVDSCSMCRMPVVLKRARTGWHYWTADGDSIDGVQNCYGGVAPRVGAVLRTLHVPFGRAWKYDPDGLPRRAA